MNAPRPTEEVLSAMQDATPEAARQLARLAFGRILRMGARPAQEGDGEEYERCRAIVMEAHALGALSSARAAVREGA